MISASAGRASDLAPWRRRRLYREVVDHYDGCSYKTEEVSSTWLNTLIRKGRHYSQTELEFMLSPGSRVSKFMIDWEYLIDSTTLDPRDPRVETLLMIGERNFGYPKKTVLINGVYVSSAFCRTVWLGSRIIKEIEESGVKNPRILEIGGGLGLLQALLKSYFGERLTLYSVDLPETLMLQEWHLRNLFPLTSSMHKGTSHAVRFCAGGFNFINAFTLHSQDIEFDMAVNVSSMQEMKAAVANRYISYLERNLVQGGLFFSLNCYGHAEDSVSEPSEYGFGVRWQLKSALIVYAVEMAGGTDHMLFLLRKTANSYCITARRYIMRFLWNGMLAGVIRRNSRSIPDLLRIAEESLPLKDIARRTLRIARRRQWPITHKELDSLIAHVHFSPALYSGSGARRGISSKKDFTEYATNAVWAVQGALITSMDSVSTIRAPMDNPEPIRRRNRLLCGELAAKMLALPRTSEYWLAFTCAMLLALDDKENGLELGSMCVAKPTNCYWKIRVAHLFAEFGLEERAHGILRTALVDKPDDPFLLLKAAEIFSRCEDTIAANKLIDDIVERKKLPVAVAHSLARTASVLNRHDIVRKVCLHMINTAGRDSFSQVIDVALSLPFTANQAARHGIIHELESFFKKNVNGPRFAIEYGCFLMKISKMAEGLRQVESAMQLIWDSHFETAWAGRMLQRIDHHELARACLERSAALFPTNFKHMRFLGDTVFSAMRFREAGRFYRKAAAIFPYFRNIRYRAAYCRLPSHLIKAGVFGHPQHIDMICQEEQAFYHDIGPRFR